MTTLWKPGQYDADGREYVRGSTVHHVSRLNCNQGSFANPETLTHWGAAKDGKFYAGGVESVIGGPFAIDGQPNFTSWRFQGGLISADGSKYPDPQAITLSGDKLITPNGGAVTLSLTTGETGFPHALCVQSDLRWYSLGDEFDFYLDYEDFTLSSGTDLALVVEVCRGQDYLRYCKKFVGGDPALKYTLIQQNIAGAYVETATGFTDSSEDGTLRIWRNNITMMGIPTVSLFKRDTPEGPWQEVGDPSGYECAAIAMLPVNIRIYLTGDNNSTGSVKLTSFGFTEGGGANITTNRPLWAIIANEEGGGTYGTDHRGVTLEVPNELAAVCTDEAVSLIDTASASKLWLRAMLGNEFALKNNQGLGDAVPRSVHWQNGRLIIALGGSAATPGYNRLPRYSDDPTLNFGAVVFDFVEDRIYVHQSVDPLGSVGTGGSLFLSNYIGDIPYRNVAPDSGLFAHARWTGSQAQLLIPDSRVFACAHYSDVLEDYRAIATGSGIGLFKQHITKPFEAGNNAVTLQSGKITHCEFDTNGNLYWMDADTLFSATKGSWNNNWGATFSADVYRPFPFTLSCEGQKTFALVDINTVLVATDVGVYAIDWSTGEWHLRYATTGYNAAHEILPSNFGVIVGLSKHVVGGTNFLTLIGAGIATSEDADKATKVALINLDNHRLSSVMSVSTTIFPVIDTLPLGVA
jgi:hypothetical protein